ncbi:MAG: hypothetical protein ACYS8L_09410 [Planctomycetota bacterium]
MAIIMRPVSLSITLLGYGTVGAAGSGRSVLPWRSRKELLMKCPICKQEKSAGAMSRGCSRCGKCPCLKCMGDKENRLCPPCREELG